jgi:hypothetical protein
MCSVHSEAFLQKCRAEECSITWSTLLYSNLYIITEEAGSEQDCRLQTATTVQPLPHYTLLRSQPATFG